MRKIFIQLDFKTSSAMDFRTIYKFLFLVIFSFGILSCTNTKKDLNEVKPTEKASNKNFEVKNGRLVFINREAFRNTLEGFQAKGEKVLDNWEKAHGFTSYRKYHKSANYEDPNYMDMPEPLATLFNTKGEYQIGDSIMWITNNKMYVIPDNNESLLRKIQNNPAEAPAEVSQHEFIRKVPTVVNDTPQNPQARYINGKETYQHNYSIIGTRKFVYEVEDVNNGISRTLWMRSKHEYRTSKGQWRDAGEIVEKNIRNLQYSFYSCFPYQNVYGGPDRGVISQTDGSTLNLVLADTPNCGSQVDVVYIRADFESILLSPYYRYAQYCPW